jgi:hypothetical protein
MPGIESTLMPFLLPRTNTKSFQMEIEIGIDFCIDVGKKEEA